MARRCLWVYFFEVDEAKEEYIKHFENKVENSQAQYIFEREL